MRRQPLSPNVLRRLLRLALRFAAVLAVLAVLALVAITITGVPVPGSITAEGVPKVSVWKLPAAARALVLDARWPAMLVGVDDDGRLLIDRGRGVVAVADDGTLAAPSASSSGAYAERYDDLDVQRLPDRPGAAVVRRMRNAAEESDLLLVDGEREDTLLAGAPEVASVGLSPDGGLAVAFGRGPDGGRGHLVTIAIDAPPYTPREIAAFDGTVLVEAVSAERRTAWVLASPAETDAKLLAVDLTTGATSLVLADEADRPVYHANPYDLGGPRFRLLDDSTAVYVRTGPDSTSLASEFTRLWLVDLASGRAHSISPEDALGDVLGFTVSADGRVVTFVQMERAVPGLMAWYRDADTVRVLHRDRAEPLVPFAGSSMLPSPAGDVVYFQTMAADGPRIRRVALEGGPSRVLVTPPHEGQPGYAFREFTYPTSRDTIGVATGIHAFLYRPRDRDGERLPVVVVFHGGPSTLDLPHFVDPFVGLYLERGYAVVTPNYRGSFGYGTTFEQADDGVRRHEQVDDVIALADWIRAQPDLDGTHIVLTGGSWGGFMTLAGLIADSTRFRGGFAWVPATLRPDTIAQGGRLAPWNRAEFGDMRDSTVQAAIAKVSPAFNAGRIRQPVYLYQGAADARVMVGTVRQMRDSLIAHGNAPWYVESATSGHGPPTTPHEMAYVFGALLEFLDLLEGLESGAPPHSRSRDP